VVSFSVLARDRPIKKGGGLAKGRVSGLLSVSVGNSRERSEHFQLVDGREKMDDYEKGEKWAADEGKGGEKKIFTLSTREKEWGGFQAISLIARGGGGRKVSFRASHGLGKKGGSGGRIWVKVVDKINIERDRALPLGRIDGEVRQRTDETARKN